MKNVFNKIKENKRKKLFAFLCFTIVWILLIFSIKGEWLYFIPLFVADAMFWKNINWLFWNKRKKKKKKKKSELRSWFDAIFFAVIAATLLRTFLIEAYTIPTSSMEKSLLIGDFLFVSKVAYGPRVPITPLAIPLVHHTIPGTKNKSYTDILQLPYHRMKGLGKIKRNDCVVFNYPAEKLGRPIDKKENYIKRCVGIPGDTIEIVNGVLYLNNKISSEPNGMKTQFPYQISTKLSGLNLKLLQQKYDVTEGGKFPGEKKYILTLTEKNKEIIKKFTNVKKIDRVIYPNGMYSENIYKGNKNIKWNIDNYGPIVIPKKGTTIEITKSNFGLYKDIIKRYEKNNLEIINNKVYLNNNELKNYTFKMNYYWMLGDNRHNSADSRFWGFVPENHIVGKALFIWMSWNKNGSGIKKIRWKRLFNSVK